MQQDTTNQAPLASLHHRASLDDDEDAAGPAWLEHASQSPQYHGDYASGDGEVDESPPSSIGLILPDPLVSTAPFYPSTFDMEHPVAPRSSRAVTPLQEDRSSSLLHLLTERKLEKAVTGRAVGLRQLVLLSNAFASRFGPRTEPPGDNADEQEQHAFAQPGPSDLSYYGRQRHRHGIDEDELESLEDAVYRKRKEEDWLDAVLDEMLTDEDDADNYQDEPQLFNKGPAPEFTEPYVHLSIRDGSRSRQASVDDDQQSRATPDLAYADDPPILMPTNVSNEAAADLTGDLVAVATASVGSAPAPLSAFALMRDSGFLEPAAIPLPVSPDRSPEGSSSSAHSDDGNTTVAASDSDDRTEQHAPSDDGHDDDVRPAAPQWGPISIAGASLTESMLLGEANTPDLAYSVNSFFSNLSSSPSASVHLQTPSSTPPMFSSMLHAPLDEARKGAAPDDPLTDAEEAYDDDLPLHMDGVHDYVETASADRTAQSLQAATSLDLVKYDYRDRYPSSLDLSALSRLLPAFAEPKLPDVVLSGVVGRREVRQAPAARPPSPSRASSTPVIDHDGLRLPLALPYDALKGLYDSVDFGIPTAQSPLQSPVQSPRMGTSSLPPTSNFGFAALGADRLGDDLANAAPAVLALPRSRSKSMSGLTGAIEAQVVRSGGSTQAGAASSSGGVLFRSLGLLFRGGSARSFEQTDGDVDRSLFGKTSQTSAQRERCRPSAVKPFGAHFGRSDSRSPSRLRIHNYYYGNSEGDFDFGSA